VDCWLETLKQVGECRLGGEILISSVGDVIYIGMMYLDVGEVGTD
jgi:hypothetical protein